MNINKIHSLSDCHRASTTIVRINAMLPLATALNFDVNVETLENMFTVNVESEQNCPGLLLTIIQVFEELGLDVLNAEAACNDGFELAAQGVWNEGAESLDAEIVKQVVIEAIRKWMSGTASP
ncbi:uncharacterized protein LOC130814182 isoform X2 [Amaranthus tricolor]|uniref:uncharacterized protein LOC130814182 isoform X2 n=1 Tax=Amaranthus tricolor TaxID=29722 RepID=UPI00259005D4|nr:uncharacterized protein LOC130814182 isoform X2 [Amaranthus tricolor]